MTWWGWLLTIWALSVIPIGTVVGKYLKHRDRDNG